jgi:hypothetical protein
VGVSRWRWARLLAVVAVGGLLAGCEDDSADPAAGDATAPPTVADTPAEPTPPTEPVEPDPDAAPPSCGDPRGCYGRPEAAGAFDAAAIPGASGLAASERNPGVLYLLDDRPGTSEVWAVEADGTMIGPVGVEGLDALDTESLALGACGDDIDEDHCLFVGDIGDNLRNRPDITVHRVPEPDLSHGAPADPAPTEVVRLRYPDGPHDAEALLVEDGVPVIVTKAPFDAETGETGETRLYRAPGFTDGTLEDLGAVPVPPPPVALQSRFVGNVVTGGDQMSGRVVLRTYDQVVEYVASDERRPLAEFPSWPARAVPSPTEPQSEAITYAADGCGYYTAGETVGDLWFVSCVP